MLPATLYLSDYTSTILPYMHWIQRNATNGWETLRPPTDKHAAVRQNMCRYKFRYDDSGCFPLRFRCRSYLHCCPITRSHPPAQYTRHLQYPSQTDRTPPPYCYLRNMSDIQPDYSEDNCPMLRLPYRQATGLLHTQYHDPSHSLCTSHARRILYSSSQRFPVYLSVRSLPDNPLPDFDYPRRSAPQHCGSFQDNNCHWYAVPAIQALHYIRFPTDLPDDFRPHYK